MAAPIPNKHPDFIILTDDEENGLNGAMPLPYLGKSVRTPTDQFFIRSHAPVPHVNADIYRLHLEGMVAHSRTYTLDELRAFPAHTLTATIQCAGNRRTELHALAPIENELLWDAHAIGSATWMGVRLDELLAEAELADEAAHIAFEGLDTVRKGDTTFAYGSSIPRDMPAFGEVLLAYAMNGEPLPPEHGFPLRVIVPGNIGARMVKWVTRIAAQREPSENYYQRHAYRAFEPETTAENADWATAPMLGQTPLTAVIASAQAVGAPDEQGRREVLLRGYASVGLDQVSRVEVQADEADWQVAPCLGTHYPDSYHAWRIWQKALLLPPGDHTLAVRAFDSEGNTQPGTIESVWNFKGYHNHAVHRVQVRVEPA